MTTPHIRDFRDQRVHMIGIGGSSMSGLAQMLLDQAITSPALTTPTATRWSGWRPKACRFSSAMTRAM